QAVRRLGPFARTHSQGQLIARNQMQMMQKLAYADDHFHDECGVFGVFGHEEASKLTYLGVYALQHRGQESAGIVSSDGTELHLHRAMGEVEEIFTDRKSTRLNSSHGSISY